MNLKSTENSIYPYRKGSTGYLGQDLFCSRDNSVPTFVVHLNDELAGVVHLFKKKKFQGWDY